MSKLAELIPTPSPESINSGLSYARQSTMIECLGKPRTSLTTDCAAVTNARLKSLMVTESVGPFRVTGLKPAVVAIRQIFARVKAEKPQVYAEVRTAGMTCCRAVRGSKTSFSNHSWGTAIDLYFGDYVDRMDDDCTQRGLLELYPYFRAAGFFWGAEFSREDSMHFEAADETIRRWKREGKL
jgi:hypothetical protein